MKPIHEIRKEIKKEITKACLQFGTYTFEDKGASEVMDVQKYVNELRGYEPTSIDQLLRAVTLYKLSDGGNEPVGEWFVKDFLHLMDKDEDYERVWEYMDNKKSPVLELY